MHNIRLKCSLFDSLPCPYLTDNKSKIKVIDDPFGADSPAQQHNTSKLEVKASSLNQKGKYHFAYDANDRTPVIDTPEYEITELFMKNREGFILWTTVYFTLKGHSHSFMFANKDYDMKYTIEQGEGWFLNINESKGEPVTTGKQICVPKNNKHMVLNNSRQPCVYRMECPGPLDLRMYLGVPQ